MSTAPTTTTSLYPTGRNHMNTTTPAPLRVSVTASELSRVHNDTGTVGAALATIPAWSAAATALRALDASPRMVAPGDPQETAIAVLLDALRDGKPAPENLASVVSEAITAATTYQTINAARERARVELCNDLDAAVRTNWAVIFGALNDELGEVLDAARQMDDVASLSSAEAAISADRVDDWRTWQGLAARHATVRAAQSRVASASGMLEGTNHAELLFLRDPRAGFEHWRAWRTHGHLIDPRTKQRQRLTPPWPTDESGRLTVNVAGSADFLSWLLTSKSEAWVPSPNELRAQSARLDEEIAPGDLPQRAHVHRDPAPEQYVDPNTVTVRKVKASI